MRTTEIHRIGVIGAGSWGTTLANLLAGKGCDVHLWVREEEVYRQILNDGTNETFLPGVPLVPGLKPVQTYEEALSDRELVLLVVPSHVYREVLGGIRPHLKPGMSLISATKGIENDTLMIMSQVAEEVLPADYLHTFSCLAGPSFAREVSLGYPTVITIACNDMAHAEVLQRLFYTEFFRVYITRDLVGVQIAGALKNIIAIAAGAADGLNFGHNARAGLITRGLAEITRLGVAMGAHPMTLAGLAGLGDLVLTCTGDLSRNRTVGLRIGRGERVEEITHGMTMVAEGIRTTRSAYALAKKMEVDMPITNQVYEILYAGKDPRDAVRDLMTRELKAEH